MTDFTKDNVLAVVKNYGDTYVYKIAGVRNDGWIEKNIRRYNYLWIVKCNDGELLNNNYFGLSGTITSALKNARKWETDTGNKVEIHKVYLVK